MAQASGTVELLSFRRTFALLIILVVVPSAGLSGFGVLAIINERAAVEKRLEGVWSGRLGRVASALEASLDEAQVQADQPFRVTSADGETLTDVGFALKDTQIETSDPRLKAALGSLAPELTMLPERPIFFSVSAPQGSFVVVALRQNGAVVGARVAPAALQRLLELASKAAMPEGESAHFELKPVKREVAEGLVGRIVLGVADVREAALGDRELASLVLPSPLQDFRLAAVPSGGEDPVIVASARNRTVYGILLGVFYLTLIIGVVLTGRSLYREARLSRLKTDFVSLVSHELRTPLTSIRMFIETLALGRVQSKEDTQQVLDMLSKETVRLSAMIEGVLDWARIESGRKRFEFKPTEVTELIDAAVAAFKTQRVGASMALRVDLAPSLPQVDVDRDAMAGALLNLLNNAFKYTGDDKRITVRARHDARGAVAIDIADNGVGIPRSERRRVFERFYRVDNLLTRQTEGSGLGLSIAQRLAHGHGGKITVESEVGRGSTFTLHLPASKGTARP